MNLFKKAAVSLALGSMAIAPVAASAAQPLAPLSVDGSRAVTAPEQSNELFGASSIFIAVLAFAAIIAAIVIAADGTDDSPTSP